MSPYEFTGTLIDPGETKTYGANGFQKREFVLQENTESKFPNFVSFVLTKDRCSLLDSVKKGAVLTVGFYLSGRAWEDPKAGTTRYFCDHNAVKISVVDGDRVVVPEPAEPPEQDEGEESPDDDIPF